MLKKFFEDRKDDIFSALIVLATFFVLFLLYPYPVDLKKYSGAKVYATTSWNRAFGGPPDTFCFYIELSDKATKRVFVSESDFKRYREGSTLP